MFDGFANIGLPAQQHGRTRLNMDAEFFDENALAAYLGLRPKTLQRWRTERKGPEYTKFGKSVRYSLAAVRAFEADHTVKPSPPRPPAAPDTAPPGPPEEVTLTPEQQDVLNRIRAFLNSPRSDPRVPRVRSRL